MPTEHSALLSEVNTRILVYGVDLILLVLHTGPLYGWGEYSQYRGKFKSSKSPGYDKQNTVWSVLFFS